MRTQRTPEPVSPDAPRERRGIVLVFTAILLVILFGFVAFSVDYGYMALVQSELQNAADASALAAATELSEETPDVDNVAQAVAAANHVGDRGLVLPDSSITCGVFNFDTKTFTPTMTRANAVRINAAVRNQPFFFAPVIGHDRFDLSVDAIAMVNPRDVVFVVDLSGSMNDDVEPLWATATIYDKQVSDGKDPSVAIAMAQTLYTDLGFGAFPGTNEVIGRPLGIAANEFAYAELTDDLGPLTDPSVDAAYRIDPGDDEMTRKEKAYAWIIDNQLPALMPAARPFPSSTDAGSLAFYSAYLDYIIGGRMVGNAPPPPPPTPPTPGPTPPTPPTPPSPPTPPPGPTAPVGLHVPIGQTMFAMQADPPGTPRQGSTDQSEWIPPSQDSDRVRGFNSPNRETFAVTNETYLDDGSNHVGYGTFTQFILDWGRDRSPQLDNVSNASDAAPMKTQLSLLSPHVRMRDESVDGEVFRFPPRTQPMHACRRSIIKAIQLIESRNVGVPAQSADRVAIVTFDANDADHAPELLVPLTADYDIAKQACTTMQATSDIGRSTGTQIGLKLARDHLAPFTMGGDGRPFAKKVVVLMTDGVPNTYDSADADIDSYMTANPSGDYYGPEYPWLNSALVEGAKAKVENVEVHAVGMGVGAEYGFLDRLARTAATDTAGEAPRSSGDPAAYESELTAILEEIIRTAGTRLVQ